MSKVPSSVELQDVQQSFRYIWQFLNPLLKAQPDMNGRRYTNVGDAQTDRQWVTLGQADRRYQSLPDMKSPTYRDPNKHIDDEISKLAAKLRDLESLAVQQAAVPQERLDVGVEVFQDTHANRANYPAAAYSEGWLYCETDRDVVYVLRLISNVRTWIYLEGIHQDDLASIPTDLGTTDVGFLYSVSDYGHILRWGGSAWTFGPGDPGSGYVVIGKPDGSAPNGGLWGLCNGSAYAVLNANGTTSSVTTQDLNDDTFLLGGASFDASPRAAVRGKWESAAKTDAESAHTHSVNPPSTNSGAPSATTAVQSGSGTTVATDAHIHATDIAAVTSAAGSAHQHVLSDATAQLKVPSEANGGVPKRSGVALYIRR
jgi:hypothetical protein